MLWAVIGLSAVVLVLIAFIVYLFRAGPYMWW
jgi:hypothetical protein